MFQAVMIFLRELFNDALKINGRWDFFIVGKKYCKYKKGLGSAHPAFCSTFL
jgi:hypothetical protein